MDPRLLDMQMARYGIIISEGMRPRLWRVIDE